MKREKDEKERGREKHRRIKDERSRREKGTRRKREETIDEESEILK